MAADSPATRPRDLRVGLIGFGAAGAFFHAPLIATTAGLRLVMIVTSNPERSRSAASAYPQAHVPAHADELWDHASELDLVVIATPNQTHAALAERALNAGLPVIVDKPLAPTAREGRMLVELAQRSGLLLTVFQNRRWDGDFLTVRRLMAEGRLGDVFRFESRFERWRATPKPGWRQDPDPAAAGGVLYDLGSHLIDQALLLFGPVRHLYAELDARNIASDVDDDAFVALTHESGARSHLWMSTFAAQQGPRMRVLGSVAAYTKYGLDIQEHALRAGHLPDSGWGLESEADWGRLGAGDDGALIPTEPGAYPAFYRGIVDALRTGAPPPVDPADAVAVIEVIEAARRSAAEGSIVALDAWRRAARD
jgi:scyllo-inositol 2-dehydrogenase (NADP+)